MRSKDGVINIHGKEYQTVALRVSNFRTEHPTWTLLTEILSRDSDCVVMQATICDETGRILANGHAEEYRSASSINKTSALENCETSAIGRALAALGYGGTEFASADELVNAIKNKQPAPKPELVEAAKTIGAASYESCPPHIQQLIREKAAFITELYNSPTDGPRIAYENYVEFRDSEEMIDAQYKAALRGMFPSNIRSAFQGFAKIDKEAQYAAQP